MRNKRAKNSGRKICKETIFAMVGRLPVAKMLTALTRMSPEPILRQRALRPSDTSPPSQLSVVNDNQFL